MEMGVAQENTALGLVTVPSQMKTQTQVAAHTHNGMSLIQEQVNFEKLLNHLFDK